MSLKKLFPLFFIFCSITAVAQWSSSGSDIYYNSGNVGVGLTSPAYSLDVDGDLNIGGGDFLRMGGSPVLGNPGTANAFIATSQTHGSNSGIANTFIGFKAGENNGSGNYNAFIGYRAGNANNQGGFNAFIGAFAGQNNITGKYNSFIGYRAGDANTYGEYNNYIGLKAGFSSTTGNYNSSIGYEAGYSSTNGDKNVFLGYQTGYDNTTGYNNTYIGSEADGSPGINNATAIGYGANVSSSNSVVLGNSAANVGIGTTNPNYKLHVDGSTSTAIYATSTGTTYDRTIEVVNTSGTAVAIGAGQTLSGYLGTPTGLEVQGAAGHQGIFSSTEDEEAIIGQTDGGGDAIEGWVTSGSGRSGYFHGGMGVLVEDGLETDGITMSDDESSITFSNSSGANNPMIHMFQSGTSNSDRMVIAHSSAYDSYGLQYTDSDDKFHFLGNGNNVATFDLVTRRVGIGTDSPGVELEVNGTTETNQLNTSKIKSTGDVEVTIDENNNGSLTAFFEIFNGAGNHAFYVTENGNARIYNDGWVDGNLGIGTTSPTHDIHLHRSSGTSYMRISDGTSGTTSGLRFGMNGSGAAYILNDHSSSLNFGANGSTDVSISSAGNVDMDEDLYVAKNLGVGTTSPSHALHVNAPTGQDVVRFQQDGDTQFNIGSSGGVNIGSSSEYAPTDGLYVNNELLVNTTSAATGYMVSVNGDIICEELKVQDSGSWPDYVFDEAYELMPLAEVEKSIKEHKHLPNIPSANEVNENGILVGDMQKKLMEKIEELTLYTIQQQKELDNLKKENEELRTLILND